MGALTYHEGLYPTEFPSQFNRTLEVVTFNNAVELRIGATGDESMNNHRVAITLTKEQASALVADLQRATDRLIDID